jgi:FkbH-like protein
MLTRKVSRGRLRNSCATATIATPHKPPDAASTPAQRGFALVTYILRLAHWFAARRAAPSAHAGATAPLNSEYHAPADVLGIQAPADFLWLWLRTGEPAYADLYRGICLSELATAPADATVNWRTRTELMLGAVDQRHALSATRRATLVRLLDEVHAALPTGRKGLREVRLLFVGDCLFEEVALFLNAECLKDGLLVRAEHIVSKNPVEQHRQIRTLDPAVFLAVFYSPFTYSFDLDFAQLLKLSHARASAAEIDAVVAASIETVARTIDVLGDIFECPVFVSNASTLKRGETYLRRAVKAMATQRTRARARATVNAWLPRYLEQKNRSTFRHLFLIDEAAVAPTEAVQRELGAYLYTTRGLHPTRFSRRLAAEIAEQVQAAALCTRKLVICDLDNTLWEGIIGEGLGVRHHRDRQEVLHRLREKGVILAIASKNDPEKITWTGGVLDAMSFVAAEVSWTPKVQGIQRIYRELNIKPKDGVFIDDRPDEREMVGERWPEMTVLDPCESRTWRVFRRWAELLDGDLEFDRTAIYKQREQRDAAISATQEAEAAEMFARLGLTATLREADRPALKRVSELINRTNQWNLAASRTTFREVQQWHTAADLTIYTVQVDDRFGSMGTVCVVVVRAHEDHLAIPVFVLSCRVFGFGVETLVLEHLKRVAQRRFGAPRLRGVFTPTEHNAPCRDMYCEHGFIQEGEGWSYAGQPSERALPTWFTLSGFLV